MEQTSQPVYLIILDEKQIYGYTESYESAQEVLRVWSDYVVSAQRGVKVKKEELPDRVVVKTKRLGSYFNDFSYTVIFSLRIEKILGLLPYVIGSRPDVPNPPPLP